MIPKNDEQFEKDLNNPHILAIGQQKLIPKELEADNFVLNHFSQNSIEEKEQNPKTVAENVLFAKNITKDESSPNNNQRVKDDKLLIALEKKQELEEGNLKLSIWDYIIYKIKFFCKKRKDPKQRLIHNAEKIYEREMDIVNILERIQDIEKLKIVLLDDDQKVMFSLLDKPIISFAEFRKSVTMGDSIFASKIISPTLRKENIISSYDRLAKRNDETSKRILMLVEKKLLK